MNDKVENDAAHWRNILRKTGSAEREDLLQRRILAAQKPDQRESALEQLQARKKQQDASSYAKIRHELYQGLVEVLNPQAVATANLENVQNAIREFVDSEVSAEETPLSNAEHEQLLDDLLYEILGLGPLTPLMGDPSVTDILINGPDNIYVERRGLLEKTNIRYHDQEHLMLSIERILMTSGRRVDESRPMADARLPDGSRVNVIIPPLAVNGPLVSIRRFAVKRFTLDGLVEAGTLVQRAAEFLKLCIQARLNIIISGGTGSGKTTFLNAVAEYIPPSERILTIEDTAELRLPHEHLGTLEARPENVEGEGEVTIRQLVRNALRMRPDRIIVGESRGPEALDMLQAMNTGHEGSITTVHSNSPRDTLSRLETMMLMADVDLPQRVLREQISSAIHLIVHLSRLPNGQRKAMYITEVDELDSGVVLTQDIFTTKRDDDGYHMKATGAIPIFIDFMYQNGVNVDESLFAEN
ncbi:MAG: CpaF family protein [Thiotrichales bacterium]|nr:CpaF family protein [Thiotrichales bacterium]